MPPLRRRVLLWAQTARRARSRGPLEPLPGFGLWFSLAAARPSWRAAETDLVVDKARASSPPCARRRLVGSRSLGPVWRGWARPGFPGGPSFATSRLIAVGPDRSPSRGSPCPAGRSAADLESGALLIAAQLEALARVLWSPPGRQSGGCSRRRLPFLCQSASRASSGEFQIRLRSNHFRDTSGCVAAGRRSARAHRVCARNEVGVFPARMIQKPWGRRAASLIAPASSVFRSASCA